jgi:hypothetical protein
VYEQDHPIRGLRVFYAVSSEGYRVAMRERVVAGATASTWARIVRELEAELNEIDPLMPSAVSDDGGPSRHLRLEL